MQLNHIAIIMDGNGRWASRRGLPRSEGHREGTRTAGKIARAARRMKIPFLTLYTLSTENLYRPQQELDVLTTLMRHYLDHEVEKLIENKIRLRVIGDRRPLPADLRKKVAAAERDSKISHEMTLTLAICYGGRDEIVRAVRSLSKKPGLANINEKRLASALDTAEFPDPDLVIRTGGDCRISNFLLWELAYSELYFTRVLWPDFSTRNFKAAIAAFERRERRFGRTRDDHPGQGGSPSRKKGKLR